RGRRRSITSTSTSSPQDESVRRRTRLRSEEEFLISAISAVGVFVVCLFSMWEGPLRPDRSPRKGEGEEDAADYADFTDKREEKIDHDHDHDHEHEHEGREEFLISATSA
ncbi:MAG: hypothetical protein WAO00_02190, partial [Chthoniobacterales bacterium]